MLAGAQPILADQASQFGLKLAEGAKTGPDFYVGALANSGDPTAGHKTVRVPAMVLEEGAFNWTAT